MKKVRAKLICASVTPDAEGELKTAERVNFETRYNQNDSAEDNSFSAATPSANFSMHLSNAELFGAFEVGKAYYFDITACE